MMFLLKTNKYATFKSALVSSKLIGQQHFTTSEELLTFWKLEKESGSRCMVGE